MSNRLDLRGILVASRPVSWINTGLPFLAATFEETRALTPLVVLGTLYFLGPYNLLLYGVNDLFDWASDVTNPRKGSVEGGRVAPGDARRLWVAVVATNVPPLAILAILGGPVAAVALAITVAVALAYSAPPLRTKVRPVLDSTTSALHFVLPAVCGFLVAGRPIDGLPWLVLAGFLAWGIASHAVGAIQDIAYDRAAGIGSIAMAFGARPAAGLALGGYAVAVAAAAALGPPFGWVAAAALLPYLLLPAMVLARPTEAQARRAWRSFMGLNILAGFVLTQALLRHWGVTRFDSWELTIAAGLVATGIVLANVVLTSWATRRAGAPHAHIGPTQAEAPIALTVVLPVRDEASRLPAALDALVRQHHVELHVVVVDDDSCDDTVAVADRLLAPLGARGRVLAAPARPSGTNGKSWGAHHGVLAASTELVLVLDADTVLEPGALATLAAEQRRLDADLLSGVTRYAMPTLGEQVAMPGFGLLLFGFVPVWWSALRRGRSPLPFAYGPLELVRRSAYLESGGHLATAASDREDVDLAATFARAGRRIGTIHAADLAATRHYASAPDAARAWLRILPAYAGGSVAVALATIVGQLLAFALPLVLPFAALAVAPDRLVPASLPLLVLVAARVVLAATQRQPLLTVALHPVTALLTLGAQVVALAGLVMARPIRWRGRTVGNEDDAAGEPVPGVLDGGSAAAAPHPDARGANS